VRLNPSLAAPAAALMAVTLSAAAHAQALPAGHAAAGANVFRQCQSCHAVGPGAQNGVGPSLNGVVGRHSASGPGFHYSSAMKASGLVWTPANISRFIAAPSDVVPGTHMTYSGLAGAQDRADVIAYLAQYGPDGQPRK
jgi:cytochrome c